VRSIAFQSTAFFLSGSRLFLGSPLFFADKFGDLSLQESELQEVTGSDIGHLPPALVRVGLVIEAQLRHGPIELGKMDTDLLGDTTDHNSVVSAALVDPIYQSPLQYDSEGGREVYMVGQGEELLEKTTKEIAPEGEEEIL
jgi:hypothetical protein